MSIEADTIFGDLSVAQLEVDSHTDPDSALGDTRSTGSITTSITSSVREFRFENGRRYHAFKEDAYFLPNDEIEAERLDLQHYTWKMTFDGGFGVTPINDNVKRVLDVGTGTGIWAIEFADAFPEKTVVGTDLSPIQPSFVPPNCQFIVDDAESDWAYDYRFDYIHMRMLVLGIHDWPRLFKQAWDHLEPGGWVETQESQFPCHRLEGDDQSDSAFIQWGNNVYDAAAKVGIDARASDKFSDQLRAQGFVNVERIDVQWPIRRWAKGKKNKVIGDLLQENLHQALPAIAMKLFTRMLGWTREAVEVHCMHCRQEIDDKANHFFANMVLHRAQKPENSDPEHAVEK